MLPLVRYLKKQCIRAIRKHKLKLFYLKSSFPSRSVINKQF
ncbi:MAG TPA: hypothetical protein DEB17_07940 [Chlorobaculum sp.]|uniref:Uncharacterized protein n=1 Tax=Chlorobaculum tepidum (strain ATCC 49652 / DSM 12025 / NBRC 103806 / TLS) TaxID=194439 RepID=Q8KD29_CHLTE|nr:hypothetical protein CT1226 [Chlorobaculum tepidum TLS]HBU23902.1 hypothetical protein [Chlorobaculum sp.]